jgi:hypothetical protein
MRAALLLTLVLGACSTVRPFAPAPIPPTTATQQPMRPGLPPTGNPVPTAMPGRSESSLPLIQRQCRGVNVPRQYVVVSYEQSAACPKVANENEFTMAVIELHSNRQIGEFMTVCDDQGMPRGWVRDRRHSPEVACPGARVGDGKPTSVVIRKQR